MMRQDLTTYGMITALISKLSPHYGFYYEHPGFVRTVRTDLG